MTADNSRRPRTTPDYSGLLRTTPDNSGQLLTTPYNSRQLRIQMALDDFEWLRLQMALDDSGWLQETPDTSGQLWTSPDNSGQLWTTTNNSDLRLLRMTSDDFGRFRTVPGNFRSEINSVCFRHFYPSAAGRSLLLERMVPNTDRNVYYMAREVHAPTAKAENKQTPKNASERL